MTKNLKLSFLLFALASAIVIAWRTLYTFFSGVGVSFVALLVIVVLLTLIMLTDKFAFNRTKDLFILTCVFAVLELIVYFAFEFIIDGYSHIKGFLIYQNVISILGLVFFAYLAFRFILEFKGVKLGFVEFVLGNEKPHKQPKKAIELENGTLEEKPNSVVDAEVSETTSEPETKEEE